VGGTAGQDISTDDNARWTDILWRHKFGMNIFYFDLREFSTRIFQTQWFPYGKL